MLHSSHISALLLSAFLALPVHADYSTDQIQMAASGRFDLLEKSVLEYATTHSLTTRDLHVLCYAYSKTKRYKELLICLDDLEVKVGSGDRRTRLFGLADATPAVLIMRAEALIELGQYNEAINEANKAVLWLKADDSEDLDMVCNALAALALARVMTGDKDGGWLAEKEIRSVNVGILSDYANAKAFALARTRMGLKEYQGVIEAIRGDSTFSLNVFLDRLVSGSFLTGVNNWVWAELPRAYMLNKALLETGQSTEAKAGFDRLLGISQVKENGEIFWLLLSDRGRIAEAEGQIEEALKYYGQAIDIVESQRASINTEASKIGFVGDKQALYARVIDLSRQLNRPELAFEYIERSKSRTLIDLLAGRSGNQPLTAKDDDIQKLLEKYQAAKDDSALQLPLDMARADTGKTRQTTTEQAKALLVKAPELASLITVNSLQTSEILQYLRPDEVLIEYFGFGDSIFAIAMNGKESLLLHFDAKNLETEIREFRAQIQDQSPKTTVLANSFYEKLIKPFERIIGSRNLLIVPHGALHYLPFAALNDGKDSLIAKRNLRFLPSASMQKYIRPSKKQAEYSILIYGNPDLGNKSFDLPSAEDEAKGISALLPNSNILTRQKATETSFKKMAGKYHYLHFASHGQFKSDNALDSRLLLAKDAENDGSLTVREIYDIRLDAELVTLSACETGLGKVLSGDDLVGLTRGFLYAGSSNIVASLWEVDDEATATLMKNFYSRLKGGMTKKEALRQAQLDVQKRYPSPVFWAAFYLTGEGI